jgi:RNA polymerase sigma-70 factor, ECF subfamily
VSSSDSSSQGSVHQQVSADENPDWQSVTDRIRNGDKTAEVELYAVFSRGIRYYVARKLGREGLDDKVHDCFLITIQAIRRGDVREPERLMGFVRTIVRRKIGEAIGERVEERARLCVSDITVIDRVVHNTTTPEHEFNEKQRAELARAEIAKLAARDREILTRFYILDQSKEQIRREMNLTETQFRLLKSRTKATLVERTSKLRTGGGRGSAVPVLPVN